MRGKSKGCWSGNRRKGDECPQQAFTSWMLMQRSNAMSDRNHRENNSILAIATVALLLIFGMIGYFLGEESGQSRSAQAKVLKHSEDAAAYIAKNCRGGDVSAMQVCMFGAIETSGEYQRAEYDLAAQQQMAEWAKWLLVVSVISASASALGIYIVWRTLIATRQMVTDTRNIGNAQIEVAHDATRQAKNAHSTQIAAQVKPFLTIECSGPTIDNYEDVEKKALSNMVASIVMGATVKIRNVSNHLAVIKKVRLFMVGYEGLDELNPYLGNFIIQPGNSAWIDRLAVAMELNDEMPATTASIARGPRISNYEELAAFNARIPPIRVIIEYCDVFGNSYEVGRTLQPSNGWSGHYQERDSYDKLAKIFNSELPSNSL